MARQEIDLTTPQPNGKMGEPTKAAWEKVNDMTAEIFSEDISNEGLVWTASQTPGQASFKRISASIVDNVVTTNTVQKIQSAKTFEDESPTVDKVEISKLGISVGNQSLSKNNVTISKSGISGSSSQASSISYGFTYDSKLPNVSDNIVARFQAMDVTGGESYARIIASNYLGTTAEYLFSHTGTATCVNWQSTSDERIKSDFVEIEDALEKLKSITGYASFSKRTNTFENAHPRRVVMSGVKAQDVQAVLPNAVSSSMRGYDNENNLIDGILSVDPMGICALIIEAVKELSDKFDEFVKNNS